MTKNMDMNMQMALAMRAIEQAATKAVTVQIATDDLTMLNENEYKLCFAKKMGDKDEGEADYNVVWQAVANRKYSANNTISWIPQYQIFCCNSFTDKAKVDISTDVVDIGIGEIATVDINGVMYEAKTGGEPTALNLDNQWQATHPGVNQVSTVNGTKTSTPFYVAPKLAATGKISLWPKEKILVWFEQNIETSTMFSTSRSKSIEVDLTKALSRSVWYEKETWSIV